jgi:hypothetical protein
MWGRGKRFWRRSSPLHLAHRVLGQIPIPEQSRENKMTSEEKIGRAAQMLLQEISDFLLFGPADDNNFSELLLKMLVTNGVLKDEGYKTPPSFVLLKKRIVTELPVWITKA